MFIELSGALRVRNKKKPGRPSLSSYNTFFMHVTPRCVVVFNTELCKDIMKQEVKQLLRTLKFKSNTTTNKYPDLGERVNIEIAEKTFLRL